MNIAVIGCGYVGAKRAKYLGNHRLRVACDTNYDKAVFLAKDHPGTKAVQRWQDAADDPEIEVAIVSTTHDCLAPVTLACLEAGKHVLVDKPGACRPEELDAVIAAGKRNKRMVRTGFNHRFHPAIRKAHQMVSAGELGPLMYIRGRYGHGGRPGYEKEWRANPQISGGGELLDQGMHLIDLSRWFLGEFVNITGSVHTYYWNMPVEDNGFMMLRTAANQMAWLHVSWTEWKNTFSLEIFGQQGKLQIDGLGGSYGTEQLTFHKMLPKMGPPETEVWKYPEQDNSWRHEFEEFMEDIKLGRQPKPNAEDAQKALQIVTEIYQQKSSS